MNIEQYVKYLETTSPDKGFAFLAHRVPTSPETPYHIATSDPKIQPNTPILLILGGSGGGTNVEGHNGLLKTVDNFIRSNTELDKTQVHIAICNWGTEYDNTCARNAFIIKKRYPLIWKIMQNYTKHPLTNMPENNYAPKAVEDIFNTIILPRITTPDGHKLPTDTLLKNLRQITIVAYCAGGHTAMKLEELTKQKMKAIGYTETEIIMALNQLPVIGYAMSCPYEQSNMKFFAFATTNDSLDPLEERLFPLTIKLLHKDIGCVHFTKNNSDIFYCTKTHNYGIEGNPNIITVIPIEEYLKRCEQENDINHTESETDTFTDHTFIGFVPKIGYSNGAKQLQTIFSQIIKQTISNSIQNAENEHFVPLPPTNQLITDQQLLQQANNNFTKIKYLYTPFKIPFGIGHTLAKQLMLGALRDRLQRNK